MVNKLITKHMRQLLTYRLDGLNSVNGRMALVSRFVRICKL